MAIDPGIALNTAGTNALAATAANPVGQFGNFANALAAGTQAKQAMLGFQANQALGQAYASNLNPDGTVNYPGVSSDLASTPAGSYVLPQAIAEGQSQQKSQYQLNADQLAQVQSRTQAFDSALTPLLRKGSSLTPGDVFNTVAGLSSSGIPVGEFARDMAATMPTLDPSQMNNPTAQAAYGQQLQNWLYNHAARSWPASVGVDMSAPHPTTQDTGGGIRVFDANPFTNPALLNGGEDVNKTLSPGEQADQATVFDAKGNPYNVPRATLAGMQGQGGLVPPGEAPGGSGGGVFGSGRYGQPAPSQSGPSPFDGASVGAAGPSSSPFGGGFGVSGIPPNAVRAGLGPAAVSAQHSLGDQAAGEAGALFSQAQGVPDRKAMLSDMEASLANAPTGPGANNQAYWSAFANSHFPRLSAALPGIVQTPQDVASFENFEKMAARFAQNQAGSLGTVTNDKLSSAMASNPNTVFSTLGNQGVIHILQGNEDAISAKNTAWQNFVQGGGDPSTYQQWSTQFNNSGFDPRTFWMKNMTPDERSRYIGTLTPTQAKTFYQNVRTGMTNGWVSPSDFAAGASNPPAGGAPNAPVANPANGY